jgi:pyruvate/2-oxoglutarate dehydrogenase complex dihydrolipoamide acyltransferase (E2) component
VREGENVEKGKVLFTINSMKTEHQVFAPFSSKCYLVKKKRGEFVSRGEEVLTLELPQDQSIYPPSMEIPTRRLVVFFHKQRIRDKGSSCKSSDER